MKKYLLLAVGILLFLSLNSCSKPTGDPVEDAELLQGIYEQENEMELDMLQKAADYAEYYAENCDKDDWDDLGEELNDIGKDVKEQYEDEIEELNDRIEDAEKSLRKKEMKKSKDSDDDTDEDDYDE